MTTLKELLNLKVLDCTFKFTDQHGNDLDWESPGRAEDERVLQISVHLPERELDDPADAVSHLIEAELLDTCCECSIGWWTSDHAGCPKCEALEEISDTLDDAKAKAETLMSDLNDLIRDIS
jgi:hypothetical protein